MLLLLCTNIWSFSLRSSILKNTKRIQLAWYIWSCTLCHLPFINVFLKSSVDAMGTPWLQCGLHHPVLTEWFMKTIPLIHALPNFARFLLLTCTPWSLNDFRLHFILQASICKWFARESNQYLIDIPSVQQTWVACVKEGYRHINRRIINAWKLWLVSNPLGQ